MNSSFFFCGESRCKKLLYATNTNCIESSKTIYYYNTREKSFIVCFLPVHWIYMNTVPTLVLVLCESKRKIVCRLYVYENIDQELKIQYSSQGLFWGHHHIYYLLPFYLFFFIYKFTYLFIYFWLCWVFVAAHGLLIVVASLVAEHRL